MQFRVFHNLLSPDDIEKIASLVNKKIAKPIHGERRKMQKLIKILSPDALVWLKQKAQIKEPVFEKFTSLLDCSLIWTSENAPSQEWHMDSLEKFLVINIILESENATEFLDVPFIDNEQWNKDEKQTHFDYPIVWKKSSSVLKPRVQPGDAICFWSNTIHRGPATGKNEKRASLYMTFGQPSQTRITTDFAFPNWSWFDHQFYQLDKNKRSAEELDYLLSHEQLVDELYPLEWFGNAVRQTVHDEMDKRHKYVAQFPANANLYDVLWDEDHQYYLCQVTKEGTLFKLKYFPTQPSQKSSQQSSHFEETMSEKSWLQVKKIHIDSCSIQTLNIGGFEIMKDEETQPKKYTVYPFSHRVIVTSLLYREMMVPVHISCGSNQRLELHSRTLFFLN